MSDALASLLADLKRQLERELAAAPEGEGGTEPPQPPPVDLWDLSEQELDQAMNRRLQRLHDLLPAAASAGPHGLRQRLAGWLYRLLSPVYGPYRDLTALLTELGLATYIRLRLQEERQDEEAARLAGLEEDLALLRRRLEAASSGGGTPPEAG